MTRQPDRFEFVLRNLVILFLGTGSTALGQINREAPNFTPAIDGVITADEMAGQLEIPMAWPFPNGFIAFDGSGSGIDDLSATWYVSWDDVNLDGQFNSSDLVVVLASGVYETDADAVWSTGDFNGDGRAGTIDLVVALADGGYEGGPRAAHPVPEPATGVLGLLAITLLTRRRQRRR